MISTFLLPFLKMRDFSVYPHLEQTYLGIGIGLLLFLIYFAGNISFLLFNDLDFAASLCNHPVHGGSEEQ